MKRTKIDPQGAHGLEHLLGINTEQSNPDEVDLSFVQPVVDMQMGGYARLDDIGNIRFGGRTISIAGIAGVIPSWIRYGNAATAGDLVYDIGHHLVMFGLGWHVTFDAAGIAAFATANFFLHVRLYDSGGNYIHAHWQEVNTTTDQLIYASSVGSNGFAANALRIPVIPAGFWVDLLIQTQTGINFPANTELGIRAMGLQVPVGAPLPMVHVY